MPVHALCFSTYHFDHKHTAAVAAIAGMTGGEVKRPARYFIFSVRTIKHTACAHNIYHFEETTTRRTARNNHSKSNTPTLRHTYIRRSKHWHSDVINLPHTMHHWYRLYRTFAHSPLSFGIQLLSARRFPFVCHNAMSQTKMFCWIVRVTLHSNSDLNLVSLHLEFGANRRENTVLVCFFKKSLHQRMCVLK